MHDARERLAEQTRRAWKQRARLHTSTAVIGAMNIEKWQLVQFNQILRGAIIEQEIVINELRAELLKHTSVLS
jgi:carbonic anhydrase/acetyltransferase-like protein (isoleucine patch superfamily)